MTLVVWAVVFTVTALLVRKFYRSLLGRERVPIYWIIGHLFGGRWGGFIGNQFDRSLPETDSEKPNWAAAIFYLFLLIGWACLLLAFYRAGR